MTATDLGSPVLSFRLPQEGDWKVGRQGRAGTLFLGSGTWRIDGLVTPTYSRETNTPYSTLDEAANVVLKSRLGPPRVRRKANRVVDGVEGFVFEGKEKGGGLVYEFGSVRGDVVASVKFDFPEDSAKARGWIESVLASAKWRCEPGSCRGK